jgi:hypothetical protein
MEILGGLLDHQVLQRNKKNVSETTLIGTADSPGLLQVKATKNGKTVPGLNFKPVANVKGGKFTIKLAGIPVGGPYQITLKLVTKTGTEEVQFSDILVGDVWILGGQSNMEGIGRLTGAAKPHPLVRAFYMHDQWGVAKDPLHVLCKAVDPIHYDLAGGVDCVRDPSVGVGPGVGFGQTMHKLTGVPQGLIACAHCGTTMSQWDPVLKKLGGKSFYGATLRRFHKNGAHVAGVVWYQGCSETSPEGAAVYTRRMKNLVAAFRRDFANPTLPFAMVQIATCYPCIPSSFVEHNAWWNSIQDQERLLPKRIKNLTTVPAIDLELDDCGHISGPDQNRLGRRLAEAAWALLHGPIAGKFPIELKSIKPLSLNPMTFEVTFDNVVGSLRSAGKPAGFGIINSEGEDMLAIYRVDMKDNRVIIRTGLSPESDESHYFLHYGYGVNAYCNITDEADRSLPVFAPQRVYKNKKPLTPIKRVRISQILPGADKLQNVKCPKTSDKFLKFEKRKFHSSFYNLHDVLKTKTDDAMVFYAASFKCDEAMKLDIGFGYDGPVKMWIDGKQVYHDPNGINPMIIDQFKVPYNASKGTHEIIVAFCANFGKAWGIALRLHRTDLTKRRLKAGPDKYKLPELLG